MAQPAVHAQGSIPLPETRHSACREQLWLALQCAGSELESLAARCKRITSVVSLKRPDSVVLEIGGSLRLFGGLAAVKKILASETEAHRICAAPTPLAALWLSRYQGGDVLSREELASRLGHLPIRVTRWPESRLQLLNDMGVRDIGGCLRLPRDGFARRVGEHYLQELDYALGKRIDLRLSFESPHPLAHKIEFIQERQDLEVFCKAAHELIAAIAARLIRYQRQAQTFRVLFHHIGCVPTCTILNLVSPTHEKQRLLEPLLARLERIDLPAPVMALEILIDELVAMEVAPGRLFREADDDAGGREILVERLRGRFGASDVYGLELVSEHRPELVWSKLTDRLLAGTDPPCPVSLWADARPLWLLPRPTPLDAGIADLQYRGPVRVESEPERIESGWWDGRDIRRDYYKASTACGERLWVYRDCTTRNWYLHGIFG